MTFKDLKIGQPFEFDHSAWYCRGLERGPWVKTSARKYKKTGMKCRVGSINVKVIAS